MPYRWILAVSLAAFAACSDRFVPAPLPEGAVPFGAPPIYQTWWAQVEQCSGHSAAFGRVRWFVVPNADSFIAEGRRDNGIWIEHYRYIVLGESRIGDSLVVRHEMLHDLSGSLGHPAEYFRQKCGGVVQPVIE
jgi:hypothetical protein